MMDTLAMPEHRVLIVEDDESIRTLVEHVARRAGYETATATHGAEAIDVLDGSSHFCVVILDLMMPSVSGYEVITHIRDKNMGVPVVVATAVVRNLDWTKLDPSIVRTVLTKPFDIEKLRDAITNACGGSH